MLGTFQNCTGRFGHSICNGIVPFTHLRPNVLIFQFSFFNVSPDYLTKNVYTIGSFLFYSWICFKWLSMCHQCVDETSLRFPQVFWNTLDNIIRCNCFFERSLSDMNRHIHSYPMCDISEFLCYKYYSFYFNLYICPFWSLSSYPRSWPCLSPSKCSARPDATSYVSEWIRYPGLLQGHVIPSICKFR